MFIVSLFFISFLAMPKIAEAHCKWNHPHHCLAAVVEAVVAVVQIVVDVTYNVGVGILCFVSPVADFIVDGSGRQSGCGGGSGSVSPPPPPVWIGPVLSVGPITAENIAFGKYSRAIASVAASLWMIFSETVVQIAKAAGGPYANQPLKLSSRITNSGGATNTTFTNVFYIDIGNDEKITTHPGVNTNWDLVLTLSTNGLPANSSTLVSYTIRGDLGGGQIGLPAGTHGIIFCADVNTQISDPAQPLASRCGERIFQDTPNAPPTASLWAEPNPINSGQSTRLKWSSTDAASCTSLTTPDFTLPNHPANNSSGVLVGPLAQNPTSYAITCTGLGGSVNANINVRVLQPNVTITASPSRITSGGSVTISWNTTDVNYCTITKNGIAWKSNLTGANLNSSSPDTNITTQTIYTIICENAVSTIAATATQIVNITPVYQEF